MDHIEWRPALVPSGPLDVAATAFRPSPQISALGGDEPWTGDVREAQGNFEGSARDDPARFVKTLRATKTIATGLGGDVPPSGIAPVRDPTLVTTQDISGRYSCAGRPSDTRTEQDLTTNATSVVGASTPSERLAAHGTDDSVDPFVSRFHRLTPREVRSLILVVIERVGHGDLGDALGISRGNVANIMQSIRRKLAVPGHMDLQTFIQNVPSLAALVEAAEPSEAATMVREERRRHDLLRVTINELQSVAARARRRASSLESFPSAKDEPDARERETSMVLRVADVIDTAIGDILREARQCGPPPDPTRR